MQLVDNDTVRAYIHLFTHSNDKGAVLEAVGCTV